MPKKNFQQTTIGWAALLFLALTLAPAAPAGADALLQVMSVQEEAAAQKEADRLFNLGVPAFSRAEELAEKGLWHRVYVGPFDTEKDAAAAAAALKKNGTIKDFIVKGGRAELAAVPAGGPVPAVPANEPVAGLPAAPTGLPVAVAPTYGEPVSPEQAAELGMGAAAPPAVQAPISQVPVAQAPAGHNPAVQAPAVQSPGAQAPGAQAAAGDKPGGLPTYGQMEAAGSAVPARAGGLPAGLKPGDDLPGLAVSPDSGLLPPPPPPPVSQSGSVPAPSAGDAPDAYQFSGQYSSLAAFDFLVDLSSSMRRMSPCRGRIKEEAVAHLVRKMNHRIPSRPYQGALRVFGYKQAFRRDDFTTLYFGPGSYSRDGFESAIARLAAADSVSPFSDALRAADDDLQSLPSPKTVLMFSDFQSSIGSGRPLADVQNARRRHGQGLTVHTFYVTRQLEAERLAKNLAKAGGGQAWEICSMLADEAAFENMMLTIFGPGDAAACPDVDRDGVCDANDLCPNTPAGAPVDERGCWIAAYSQFFDFNQAVVKSEFRPRLVEAARIIKEHPGQPRVIIAGHTDNVGSQEYNLDLGRRRAQAVSDILTAEGVPPDRLSVTSFGKDRPVAANDTEEGRARNRRVEFHIGEVAGTQTY